jgi:hypothetical protein
VAYFENEPNYHNTSYWYYANLSLEIYLLRCCMTGQKPQYTSAKDFILKFKVTEGPEKSTETTPENIEEMDRIRQLETDKSKAAWFALLGLGRDGTVKTRTPPKRKNPPNVKPIFRKHPPKRNR